MFMWSQLLKNVIVTRKKLRRQKIIITATDTVVVCTGSKRDCQCHRYFLLWQSPFLRVLISAAHLLPMVGRIKFYSEKFPKLKEKKAIIIKKHEMVNQYYSWRNFISLKRVPLKLKPHFERNLLTSRLPLSPAFFLRWGGGGNWSSE